MAANISFIVGNGLDLSLGLKTRYKEFYKYVLGKKEAQTNRIYIKIKENHETWADFELALGDYTRYIEGVPEKARKKESESFHDDLRKVIGDLGKYLSIQEASIKNLAETYKFSLNTNGFFEELASDYQQDRVREHLQTYPLEINLITLNYTDTLEKILADEPYNKSLGLIFKKPLHIHGKIHDALTIGVSDSSQLYEGMSRQERDDLIKSRLINSLNDGRISDFQNTVNDSSLIVIFGCSIGDTDKYIWNYVVRWLAASSRRHIIIHKYDTNYSATARQNARTQRQFDYDVQDGLLKHIDFSDSDKQKLRSQIFVIHNTRNLFVKSSIKAK